MTCCCALYFWATRVNTSCCIIPVTSETSTQLIWNLSNNISGVKYIRGNTVLLWLQRQNCCLWGHGKTVSTNHYSKMLWQPLLFIILEMLQLSEPLCLSLLLLKPLKASFFKATKKQLNKTGKWSEVTNSPHSLQYNLLLYIAVYSSVGLIWLHAIMIVSCVIICISAL